MEAGGSVVVLGVVFAAAQSKTPLADDPNRRAEGSDQVTRHGFVRGPRAVRDGNWMAGLIVPIVLAALPACQDVRDVAEIGEGPVSEMPAAELPEYRAGDFYAYDDGITESVTAVNGNRIDWKTDHGFRFTRYANFALPHLAWRSKTAEAAVELTASPTLLWPLERGGSASFQTRSRIRYSDGRAEGRFVESSRCEVDGTASVEVAAGRFDTYKVTCSVCNAGNVVVLRRTWYYAPNVGHYVVRLDTHPRSRRRELAAYGFSLASLSEHDRRGIMKVFQRALETKPSGTPTVWRSADGTQLSDVTPTRTFRTDRGVFCRNYLQRVTLDGRSRELQGRACRSADGVWRTPRPARR